MAEDGTIRYMLHGYERFPTLDVDDGSWRGDPMGTEPPGTYPIDRVVSLPIQVYTMWKQASDRLKVIELMILDIESVQRRFDEGMAILEEAGKARRAECGG